MNYSATIETSASPQQAARQIPADLEKWWSTRVDHRSDGFIVRFNASHATFAFDAGGTATDFSWTCTDAHMIIEGVSDPHEWTGTQLVWSITPTPGGSAVRLTHKGLTPALPCFDICQRGWQHFFETSLRDHLNGTPAAPETSSGVT